MPVRAKRFEYAIEIAGDGRLTADGAAPLELDERWSADHLLLAALAHCVLTSLRYHGRRAGIDVAAAQAAAGGVVTRRESDGRYGFVEVECRLEVRLEPELEDLPELIAKAERDCFVGASLTVDPRYEWRVNGAVV